MRHQKSGKKFGRQSSERKALLRSLATSLVVSEHMTTTVAKAKAVRPFVERLVTRGKQNTLVSRRYLLKHLLTERAAKKILDELGPRYQSRPGGYTRITKLARVRVGDGAEQARIEFV